MLSLSRMVLDFVVGTSRCDSCSRTARYFEERALERPATRRSVDRGRSCTFRAVAAPREAGHTRTRVTSRGRGRHQRRAERPPGDTGAFSRRKAQRTTSAPRTPERQEIDDCPVTVGTILRDATSASRARWTRSSIAQDRTPFLLLPELGDRHHQGLLGVRQSRAWPSLDWCPEFVGNTEGEERTECTRSRSSRCLRSPGTNTSLEVASVPSTVEDVQLLEGRLPLLTQPGLPRCEVDWKFFRGWTLSRYCWMAVSTGVPRM